MTRLLLCLTTLSVLLPGSLFAQPLRKSQVAPTGRRAAQASPPRAKPVRPPNAVLQVQKLSPEFEQILKKWSDESAKIKKLEGKHTQFEYDFVFNIEKRTEGVLYFEAPDKGRIDMTPAKIEGKVAGKKDRNGKPFRLEGGKPERWVCDGKSVLRIDDKTKVYEKIPIPPAAQGKNMMDGPLPFLFGMPPAKLKRRYILKLQKNTPTQIWIAAQPRTTQDAQNYKEAQIILDAKTFLPTAIRLINPAGTTETVYVFEDLAPNKRAGFIPWPGKNPFKPNLFRYKPAQINRPTANQNAPRRRPTPSSVRQASSKSR